MLEDMEQRIIDFIRRQIESRGYGPTMREIGNALGIKSPSSLMFYLKALKKKGLIILEGYSARAMKLVDYRPDYSAINQTLLVLVIAQAAMIAEQVERIAHLERENGAKDYQIEAMATQKTCRECGRLMFD